MTETMTLQSLTDYEAAHSTESLHDVTVGAMVALGLDAQQQEVLFNAVHSFMTACRRKVTSLVEARYFAARRTATTAGPNPAPYVVASLTAARRALIARNFFNGERYVLWKDSTILDHEGAVAYIQSHQLAPALRVQDEHLQAIADMKAAGVKVFGDLK